MGVLVIVALMSVLNLSSPFHISKAVLSSCLTLIVSLISQQFAAYSDYCVLYSAISSHYILWELYGDRRKLHTSKPYCCDRAVCDRVELLRKQYGSVDG